MSYKDFEAIRISLASPETIREWSYGEVKKPETINYRTLKPERDGLFCEKIFGPTKDWECHCGKYKKIRYKNKVCDRCGVTVTKAKVRRERMGSIELAAPVSHIWYFKGIPSRMGLLLDMSPRVLEKVLYFASYIVTEPGDTPLMKKQILTEKEYCDMREKYEDDFKAGMGADAIRELLREIDIEQLSVELKEELNNATGQKKMRLIKRLEVVEAFRLSGNRPEWMIMEVIPVIPPELRPMVQLDGGRFATSDLNDLYRRVINRNNRLKRLLDLNAPDIIVRNEKRMLQEAVDSLIDNGRRGRPVTGPNNRALKSLSDMLKGKQGRFRQNLLGKRVDYSGRSVIVVGPELKIYQCGLPKEMALELFKPFVMKKLVENGLANNIKSSKKMVERAKTEVWDVLEDIIKEHPVMLNRAPTLHRLGIQAFEPVLVEGRAIKLHPLVCTAFNADFDGDQMAVHVPLSAEAQTEARILMLSANNLLRPQDGKPVTIPTQDMVLGSYYLTYERIGRVEKGAETVFVTDSGDTMLPQGEVVDGDLFIAANKALEKDQKPATYLPVHAYSSVDEAMMAYADGTIGMHAPIRVRVEKEIDGVKKSALIKTTIGRLIFNENIPQDLGFVDREKDPFALEVCSDASKIDKVITKKELGKVIGKCIEKHGFATSAEVLDNIKSTGFKYSTRGAITISVSDMTVPDEKYAYIHEGEEFVMKVEAQYKMGFITEQERYKLVVEKWGEVTDKVTKAITASLDKFNPIFMMADSGARGSMNQIRQLTGMRGLMANAAGKTLDVPIKANFREGLGVLEYFISSRGARKGMSDTALRTADSGYLTRRLVDVSQEVIIRENDCWDHDCRHDGIDVFEITEGSKTIESLEDRLKGRYLAKDIIDPKTGELVANANTVMTSEQIKKVIKIAREFEEEHKSENKKYEVQVRSVITCHSKLGVCAHCYGTNLATASEINVGESVGIIAAQSIGEPGTQLTMRTFHTGGVAGDDITQGLPRVEELFEARKPKRFAQIAEIDGKISIEEPKRNQLVTINVTNDNGEAASYTVSTNQKLMEYVKEGGNIKRGQQITTGALNPHDILRIFGANTHGDYSDETRISDRGADEVQKYIVKEVQKVYRQQGVDINDRHIEIIVRQMMRKRRIEDSGDTNLLSGTMVDVLEFEAENDKIRERIANGEENLKYATATVVLLGITKASLATDSFLSAASFQETTRVLTEAAIKGKVDNLQGLKENVIIGKLIPAGSGLKTYREFDVVDESADALETEIVEEAAVEECNA